MEKFKVSLLVDIVLPTDFKQVDYRENEFKFAKDNLAMKVTGCGNHDSVVYDSVAKTFMTYFSGSPFGITFAKINNK